MDINEVIEKYNKLSVMCNVVFPQLEFNEVIIWLLVKQDAVEA